MHYRLVAAFFAICAISLGQTMSVAKLLSFLQSSEKIMAEGKMTDKEIADFVAKVKLTEKLDDRTIEDLQGHTRLGPRTMGALRALRDRTQTLAAAAPVIAPPAPAPIPPPSSEEQAAILTEVREYALSYSKRLPDFICTQVTRRYEAPKPGTRYGGRSDSQPSWQTVDTLQIRLSYFQQKEDYKLILHNNTVTNQDYRTIGGSTSTGDFGTMMLQIFERATEARFEWNRWATLRGRRTMVFDYHVSQARSQWHITYDRTEDIVPAYSGEVFVDKQTHAVTRITLVAEQIPSSFPVKKADTTLDYDYQELSGRTFLLPMKSTTFMSANDYMTRNDTEFRLYRKYSAESDIKFDSDLVPPLPDDKTKETKDPKQ